MNTILFDLDGTLLPMDTDAFMNIYFKELSSYFEDLANKKEFISHVWASTGAMLKNFEEKTNEEVFMEDFEKRISGDLAIYKERFDSFYDTSFLKVKDAVFELPLIRQAIELLKEKGYTLVIATNPLFPRKAIYHRIHWAGLDPLDFSYISCYEKNHYCKPNLEFYREILSTIKKEPSECLMVGNDVQEDLIVRHLGIKTFLIKDHILHRTEEEIITDYEGNYTDFLAFVKKLPSL